MATNRTSSHWGTTSEPNQRKKILHLSTGATFRDQINGIKSYIVALGHHFETKATATNSTLQHHGTASRPKQRQQIIHLRIGAPLKHQSNGNTSYILALGHHFETKATATNRTSWHWGTTSTPKPKQRQQIVHLSIGAPLRDQRNGNKSYILALGHHPRDQSNDNKSIILALGHHFETKATATNRTS